MAPVQVATIKALYIYPVKSMGELATNQAFLKWHGLEGDRKYAFVQDGNTTHFPWLTAREVPHMLHYKPYFVDPEKRAKSAISVKTPDGADLPLDSPVLMENLAVHFPGKFHLIHLNIGTFDGFPISVISTETLKGLSAKVGFELESNRFRPNIVVEPLEQIDGIEDNWVGHSLTIGHATDAANIAISERDQRCVMVNYDRQTLKQTPEVLREIAQNRASCTGIYGSILAPGLIKVGDPVFLV